MTYYNIQIINIDGSNGNKEIFTLMIALLNFSHILVKKNIISDLVRLEEVILRPKSIVV